MKYSMTYRDSNSYYFTDYIKDWETFCALADDLEAQGYTDIEVWLSK